jgi:hypothetical protein
MAISVRIGTNDGPLWETGTGGLLMAPMLQHILQDFRRGLEGIYGPRLAGLVLFGSQARGDVLPDSDIDTLQLARSEECVV